MKKSHKKSFKVFTKKIIFGFFVAIIFVMQISSLPQVKADTFSDAIFSSNSEAEQQLWDKIQAIKEEFGTAVDDVALLATIFYNGDIEAIVNSQYDKNFDINEYKKEVSELKENADNLSDSQGNDDIGYEASTLSQMDVLDVALLVMLDSSGWGSRAYSDENYKKALAGKGLAGNVVEDGDSLGQFMGSVFNTVMCAKETFASGAQNTVNIIGDFFTGGDSSSNSSKRLVLIQNVCNNGFIGATHSNIQNITDEDEKQYQKDLIADAIINLAEFYRALFNKDANSCVVNPSSIGAFSSWKQYDDEWGSLPVGNGGTLSSIGCLVTAFAIQMARSGTVITNLPSGYDTFNPGALVTTLNQNGGFVNQGAFTWSGYESIAGNWRVGDSHSVSINNTADLANRLTQELSTGAEGKYQKFIVLQIHHNGSSQHWVAVDSVNGDQVTIFDPGASGNTLDDNYDGWVVDSYRVLYATDVLMGATGSRTNTGTEDYCADPIGDLAGFLAYVEGSAECNYQGQGEGTGYSSYNLNDGAGYTTAFGITENYQKDVADKVGYTNFVSDMHSGCTSKTYVDQMFPSVVEKFSSYVESNGADLGLTANEKDALTSVAYGGYNLFDNIAEKIRGNGKESFAVFDCFKSYGCSWFASSFNDGLVRRRIAEYELFRTGNYNAAKPTEDYAYFTSINTEAKMKEYMDTHWPTSR